MNYLGSEIEMYPVSSSNVLEVGYDAQNETVLVRFWSNALYAYKNVPETIFNDSKGDIASKIKHLEKHIRTTPEAESLLSLSLCYLFQGNSQKAIYYLAQVTQSS